MVNKSTSPSSTCSSTFASQVVNNPANPHLKSQANHLLPFRCEVCSIACNSQLCLASHLTGRVHRSKVTAASSSSFPGWENPLPSKYTTKQKKATHPVQTSSSSCSERSKVVPASKPKVVKQSHQAKVAATKLKEKERRQKKEQELLKAMPPLENRSSRKAEEESEVSYGEDEPPHCEHCYKEKTQFACSGCEDYFYCDAHCQKKDWLRRHHDMCYSMIDSADESEEEAWQIYREWYGHDLGNHGYSGGDC